MNLTKKPLFILDIGSNHRGKLELALSQIESAKDCGADVAKFQLFSSLELYGQSEPCVDKYSIPKEWLPRLKEHADKVGIEFMCSAFSAEGVRAVNDFVSVHKIASSEALDPLIANAVRLTGKPFIVSTGGLSHGEVRNLIFQNAGLEWALLECVAKYPADSSLYNLTVLREWWVNSMGTVKLGLSDHTMSNTLAITSVGFGATIFERHFDDVKNTAGDTPDTPVSFDPVATRFWIESIREAFKAAGDGFKAPAHQNEAMLRYRRRPIVTQSLKAGDVLSLGSNFGSYRSLVDDTRGAPAQAVLQFDGAKLKVDKLPGQSLWYDDLE